MRYSIEQGAGQVCVRLTGALPGGAEQNEFIAGVVKDLGSTLATSKASELTVDCSELDYSYGDAIGSIWVLGLKHKLRCRVLAKGVTRARLSELMNVSGIVIPISE